LDFIEEILGTFVFDDAHRDIVLGNFRGEIGEIGSNRIIFVGRIDGRAAATGQLVLKNADNDPELADGHRIAHVHNVWVRKDLGGRGLARAMMATLEARAAELGFELLTLGVDDFNERAWRLYKYLGFEEFKREVGRSAEEQLILMRKAIVPAPVAR
jgi:ribosomal protein S18 acetylase RimI-like enzyme